VVSKEEIDEALLVLDGALRVARQKLGALSA